MKEFSSGLTERRGMKEFRSGPTERRGMKELSNGITTMVQQEIMQLMA